jgi:undecaprenyl-diphosphatase
MSFDITVFNFINHTLSNHALNVIMPVVSRLGGGELYFLIGAAMLFSKKKEVRILGITLLAAMTVSYNITATIKILIARPRPFIGLGNVIVLGLADKGYSFPSGHSVTAFATAVILASHFRRHVLFYSLAAIMAFSRVYVGAHYPSDVITGSIIGILIGLVLVKVLSSLRAAKGGEAILK